MPSPVNRCGSYLGVRWVHRPLRDIMPHLTIAAKWYEIVETGDHFKTLRELYDFVDSHPDDFPTSRGPTISRRTVRLG